MNELEQLKDDLRLWAEKAFLEQNMWGQVSSQSAAWYAHESFLLGSAGDLNEPYEGYAVMDPVYGPLFLLFVAEAVE